MSLARTRIRSMSPRRRIVLDLDALFRDVILKRSGICEMCHEAPATDVCHVFTRRIEATRWDLSNAWAGCRDCHDRSHQHPQETRVWNCARLGTMRWESLRQRHYDPVAPDLQATRRALEAALEAL